MSTTSKSAPVIRPRPCRSSSTHPAAGAPVTYQADNGSPWYVTGAPNAGWDDDDLHDLGRITGADFEVVDTRRLRNGR